MILTLRTGEELQALGARRDLLNLSSGIYQFSHLKNRMIINRVNVTIKRDNVYKLCTDDTTAQIVAISR